MTTKTQATDTTTNTPDPNALFDAAVQQIEGNAPVTQQTASEEETGTVGETGGEAEETKVETKPETKAAAETKETKPSADDDVVAKLPKEAQDVVARIKADATAAVAEANQNAARHQSQVGGLNNKLREARDALDAAKKTGDAAATKKAEEQVAAASDALKKIKADYPDIAKAIEDIQRVVTESVRRELGVEIAKVQKQVEPIARTHATSLETAEAAAIEAAHPGWEKEIETEQFQKWWEKQSAGVQALAKGVAQDEISLFNLYRTAHPLQDAAALQAAAEKRAAADALAARRAKQQQDAAGPSGRRTQAPSQSQDTSSPEAMFARAVDQIEKGNTPSP